MSCGARQGDILTPHLSALNCFLALGYQLPAYDYISNITVRYLQLRGGYRMIILGEKGLSGIVKHLLDLIFIGGIGIYISLPVSLKWYFQRTHDGTDISIYYFLLVLLYVTGALALIIVNEIRKIFKTLNRRNPFMMDNVKSLNRIGIASFLIAFFYIFKIIFFNSILTVIVVMVFIIAGFFSIILAEVFRQAIAVKEENDFTI